MTNSKPETRNPKLVFSYGAKTLSGQMVVCGDGRSRAVRSGYGLQRLSDHCRKGEWHPVLLRSEAGHMDHDWLRGDVYHDAAELWMAERSSPRLRPSDPDRHSAAGGLCVSAYQRRTPLDQAQQSVNTAIRDVQNRAGNLSGLFPREAPGRRRK